MSFDPFLRVTKLGLVHHAMSSHAGFYGLKSEKKRECRYSPSKTTRGRQRWRLLLSDLESTCYFFFFTKHGNKNGSKVEYHLCRLPFVIMAKYHFSYNNNNNNNDDFSVICYCNFCLTNYSFVTITLQSCTFGIFSHLTFN